jgi:hypothetical protein
MSTRPVFRLLPADVKHGAYTGRAMVGVVRVLKCQSAGIQKGNVKGDSQRQSQRCLKHAQVTGIYRAYHCAEYAAWEYAAQEYAAWEYAAQEYAAWRNMLQARIINMWLLSNVQSSYRITVLHAWMCGHYCAAVCCAFSCSTSAVCARKATHIPELQHY